MHNLIERLCQCYGPAGHEEEIRALIEAEVTPYCDEVYTDTLGNLIAHKKFDGPKLMVAAHMDQIGLIVTHIDAEGFLYVSNIGGVSPYAVIGKSVIFKNGTKGIVTCGSKTQKKDLKLSDLFIDIGVSDMEKAKEVIEIGDVCVYNDAYIAQGSRIFSKALDNRIGCYTLIEALKTISASKFDLYFVFTAQEEVGLRGAKTAAYAIDPHIGLAVDVTGTGDVPQSQPMHVKLGGGAAIKVKDSSIISHQGVKKWLIESAKQNAIPFQLDVLLAGGTDAGAIHVTKSGVPTGGISIPTRYIHGSFECVETADIEATIDLLCACVQRDF